MHNMLREKAKHGMGKTQTTKYCHKLYNSRNVWSKLHLFLLGQEKCAVLPVIMMQHTSGREKKEDDHRKESGGLDMLAQPGLIGLRCPPCLGRALAGLAPAGG